MLSLANNPIMLSVVMLKVIMLSRETLLKGNTQCSSPPCTKLLRSAPFNFENIIYIFNKTSYLNEEVNCTEPSLSLVFPRLSIEAPDFIFLY